MENIYEQKLFKLKRIVIAKHGLGFPGPLAVVKAPDIHEPWLHVEPQHLEGQGSRKSEISMNKSYLNLRELSLPRIAWVLPDLWL